jgi:hypothetical protein
MKATRYGKLIMFAEKRETAATPKTAQTAAT